MTIYKNVTEYIIVNETDLYAVTTSKISESNFIQVTENDLKDYLKTIHIQFKNALAYIFSKNRMK